MLHKLMVPIVLLLRHQIVRRHHIKGQTAQQTQSTDDLNDSIANAEELSRNSCE